MNTKQRIYELVQENYPMHYAPGRHLRSILVAIIDALPDEPPTRVHTDPGGVQRVILGDSGVGTEPVAEKASGPTSASKYPMPSKELTRLAEHLYGDVGVKITALPDLNRLADLTRNDPRFATITYRGVVWAIVGPTELIDLTADLGQQQPPNVESQAQPVRESFRKTPAQFEEDARKLRIMKAMEELLDVDPDARFKRIGGHWGWIGDDGMLILLSPAAPEEPLWEGEVWANDLTHESFDGRWGNPYSAPGWRKIKVKEMR